MQSPNTPSRRSKKPTLAFSEPIPRNPLEQSIYNWLLLMCDITDRIIACNDIDEALGVALKQVGALLGADRCVLITLDAKKRSIISHEFRLSTDLPSILGMRLTSSQLFEHVLRSAVPIALNDFSAHEINSLEIIEKGGIKSTVVGCLRFRGSVLGILSVQDCTRERNWSAEEIGLVRWFCTTVAMFLSTMRMTATMKSMSEHLTNGLKELAAFNAEQGLSPKAFVHKVRTQTRSFDDGVLDTHFQDLTRRERQVLLRLELPNKEIANELFTSPHTIKGHISRVFQKLGVTTREEAIHRMQHALALR